MIAVIFIFRSIVLYFNYIFQYNTIILFIISFLIYGCETVTYENNLSTINQVRSDIVDSELKIKPNNNKIKIGILLPLSGENSQIGNSLLKAAQLSLNKTENKNLVLFIKDTENKSTNIITSYYDLINENVDIILGPLFSQNIRLIDPISEDENTITITFSNNTEIKNENTFISGLTPENEIREVIKYAISRGNDKFGLILPNNKYGHRAKKLIQNLTAQNNGIVTQYILYDPVKPDFYKISKVIANYENRKLELEKKLAELKNINSIESEKEYKILNNKDTLGELEFNSLFIGSENVKHISMLASILPYYDVDPKKVLYIGNSLWTNNMALKEPALDKGIFPNLSEIKHGNFETEYLKTFSSLPHQIAYLSYDLIGLISNLQKNGKSINISNLTNNNGFIGTNGLFRFTKDGDIERSLSIFQINNQKLIELKKANLNF